MKSLRFNIKSWVVSLALAMVSMFSTTSAQAADGCKFLLCIAGPWSSISQCVPTVHEVFSDVARGRPFPTCDMSGSDNSASNIWTSEPSCPSMYRQYNWDTGGYAGCTYPGRVSVVINGSLWSQVYWNGATTSTWYSSTALSSLTGQPSSLPLDATFQNDLTTWNATNVAQCSMIGGTASYDAFGAFERCNSTWESGGG